jgi:hypothetical protein
MSTLPHHPPIVITDEAVTIPRYLWEVMAPVIREALALWWDEEGVPRGPIPVDCFQYHVPVPLGDDPSPADELKQWFARRRGDVFLPLYRAAWSLSGTLQGDAALQALVAMRPTGDDEEDP